MRFLVSFLLFSSLFFVFPLNISGNQPQTSNEVKSNAEPYKILVLQLTIFEKLPSDLEKYKRLDYFFVAKDIISLKPEEELFATTEKRVIGNLSIKYDLHIYSTSAQPFPSGWYVNFGQVIQNLSDKNRYGYSSLFRWRPEPSNIQEQQASGFSAEPEMFNFSSYFVETWSDSSTNNLSLESQEVRIIFCEKRKVE